MIVRDTPLTKNQQRVIDYLSTHQSMTGTTAKEALGLQEYRKRISELRKLGYPIGDKYVTGTNRYGEKVRYKAYFLEEGTDGIQASKGR